MDDPVSGLTTVVAPSGLESFTFRSSFVIFRSFIDWFVAWATDVRGDRPGLGPLGPPVLEVVVPVLSAIVDLLKVADV